MCNGIFCSFSQMQVCAVSFWAEYHMTFSHTFPWFCFFHSLCIVDINPLLDVGSQSCFHLTPARTAKINKTTDNIAGNAVWERRTLIHWWEWTFVQALWKPIQRTLKSLWPSYTTLGHMPKGHTHYSTDVCSAMITTDVFTVARKCPVADEWIMKMW